MRVLLLSGPNLNLLGDRQPEMIYGRATLAEHVQAAVEAGQSLGLSVEHVQSNDEGRLIDAVHQARGRFDALVVNAGALTHTSWSLHDALGAFDGVVVDGLIAGFGGLGYELAMQAVSRLLADRLIDRDKAD